ncbi:hypothetical protein HZC07_02730 [Candidatus Micrarchaeota archaeon]|nr:hypothetical protein [Candidatus Micrarchaeota archaeon]
MLEILEGKLPQTRSVKEQGDLIYVTAVHEIEHALQDALPLDAKSIRKDLFPDTDEKDFKTIESQIAGIKKFDRLLKEGFAEIRSSRIAEQAGVDPSLFGNAYPFNQLMALYFDHLTGGAADFYHHRLGSLQQKLSAKIPSPKSRYLLSDPMRNLVVLLSDREIPADLFSLLTGYEVTKPLVTERDAMLSLSCMRFMVRPIMQLGHSNHHYYQEILSDPAQKHAEESVLVPGFEPEKGFIELDTSDRLSKISTQSSK